MKNILILILFFGIFLDNSYAKGWVEKIKEKWNVFSHQVKKPSRLIAQENEGQATTEKKTLNQYLWLSQNTDRSMEVHFICSRQQMDINIKDPQQKDYVKGYPAYIKMSVEYSPILGAENDIRLTHRGGLFKTENLLEMDRKHIPQFLENLRILHGQDIKNKKRIREEYDRAVQHCETLKNQKKDSCFNSFTPGAYLFSDHPVILLNVISQVIPPKTARPFEVLALFNSEELFRHLKEMPCYKAKEAL